MRHRRWFIAKDSLNISQNFCANPCWQWRFLIRRDGEHYERSLFWIDSGGGNLGSCGGIGRAAYATGRPDCFLIAKHRRADVKSFEIAIFAGLVIYSSVGYADDIDCDSAKPVAAYLHHRAASTPVHRNGPKLLRKPVTQVGCTRESLHGVVPVVLNDRPESPATPIVLPPVVPIAADTPTGAIAAATPSGFPVAVGGAALLLGAVLCITRYCGGSDAAGHTTAGTTGTTGTVN